MKQQQILNAYKVIQKYSNDKLPLDISYAFFKLKKALQEQWEFELERERKIFDKYHPTQEEDGQLKFDNDEDMKNFSKELTELLDMEVDMYDFSKIKVDFGGRLDMPVVDIEALDDFITFEPVN